VEALGLVDGWPAEHVAVGVASARGTLFVHVTTNAWMNELSLLEPELLKSLNGRDRGVPIRRIRWLLSRGS